MFRHMSLKQKQVWRRFAAKMYNKQEEKNNQGHWIA